MYRDFEHIGDVIREMVKHDDLSGKHSDKYKGYIKSPAWRQKRKLALYHANNRCARCNWQSLDGKLLEVHHKTYKHLGDEPLSDLEVLCQSCHRKADKARELETKARAEGAYYEARLDGWATKVYGENWADRSDVEEIEERFDEWLESRDED